MRLNKNKKSKNTNVNNKVEKEIFSLLGLVDIQAGRANLESHSNKCHTLHPSNSTPSFSP